MSANTKPLICLVDDDPDLRNALRLLLKSEGMQLVSHATAKEFLSALDKDKSKPIGCLLLDIRMTDMGGLELLRELHRRKIAVPVVLLTGHATVPLTVEALRTGALDVIEKPFKDEHLLEAIRSALDVYSHWRHNLLERQSASRHIGTLTPRERSVLKLMVRGIPNRQIAEELGISPKTLDIHRANVIKKMEARTTADLVRAHLLETSDPLALRYLFADEAEDSK